MKRILILTIAISLLSVASYSFPSTYTASFKEAQLMIPEIVEFIKDVVIPVAKSADYRSDEDEIYIKLSHEDDSVTIVDITFNKGIGAYFNFDSKIELDETMQYLTFIDDIPIFLSSDQPSRFIKDMKKTRKLTIGCYTLQVNDACISWYFNMRNGTLLFDCIFHFSSSWIKDKLYRSLLPPEIRIKKLECEVPQINVPKVAQKPCYMMP